MNKLPKIFLTLIALLIITDTYAGVADGLDAIMNPHPNNPPAQKLKDKAKPASHKKAKPRVANKNIQVQHDSSKPPAINPQPLPSTYTLNRLKTIWLKEVQNQQTNLPVHIDKTNVDSLLKSFVDGTIELGQPSVGYKEYRPKLWEFYAAKEWESLAKTVIEGGSNQDVDWFYLGRSAEGLKLFAAAKSYYAKGIVTKFKCEKIPTSTSYDGCDGFIFPQAINAQIEKLAL